MKKLLSFFLVLTITVGVVMAQGIGLTAGVELGFDGLNARHGEYEWWVQENITTTWTAYPTTPEGVYEITEPYLMPFVYYDKSLFNGGLDIFAEADLRFGLYKDGLDKSSLSTDAGWPWAWERARNIDFLVDIEAANNLRITSASTLSFLLGFENDFHLSPDRTDDKDNLGRVIGIIKPGIKFKQGLGFGDLYFQVDLPVSYWSLNDQPNLIYLGFSVGWDSTFGLGVKLRELNLVATLGPDNFYSRQFEDIRGVQGFGLTVSYNVNPIYAEVEVRIPRRLTFDGFPGERPTPADAPHVSYNESPTGLRQGGYPGITVVPRIEVSIFRGLQAYVELTFEGLGASFEENRGFPEKIPVKHSQAYGIKYSF